MAEKKNFSHAYLFAGPEKLGKRTLALEWASLLFNNAKNVASHPDFMLLEPIEKEIKISQIRSLIQKMSLKSSSLLKVAIIDNAHAMNQESQTALLKTLEEPRGDSILILISDKTHYLFSTILSRVQTIRFNPVSDQEISEYLLAKDFSPKEVKSFSCACSGRPGIAMDFIADKKEMEIFSKKLEELRNLSKSMLYSRFQYVKDLSEEPSETQKTLDIWLNYFRGIMLSRFSLMEKEEAFKNYSVSKLKNIINLIQNTKLLLFQTNVNSRLALERLVMEI